MDPSWHSGETRPIAWSAVCLAVAVLGTWLVFRLQSGHLYLISLPWDGSASADEIADAAARSRAFLWGPAVAMTCLFGLALLAPLAPPTRFVREIPARVQSAFRIHPWLATTLLVAGSLDFATTFAFFQRGQMHLETHPGVVLTAYAFGRTVGLIAAKMVQLGGLILLVSYLSRRVARLLLAAGAALCLWAAAENSRYLGYW